MITESKYKSLVKKLDYLTWHMHNNVTKEEQVRWLAGVFYNLNGYYPNFKNPQTFNEKICWLRLNYCNGEIVKAVDKVEFSSFVSEKIGDGYTAKKYGVYHDPMGVNFNTLPDKFVLKSSYSSASNNIIFVNDKSKINFDEIRYQMSEWLQPWNSSAKSFSCWYKNAKPRILAEELLECGSGDLKDYKFMCFNGEPKCLFVVSDRFGGKYVDFYDMEWNHLPFERKFKNSPYGNEKPSQFAKMVDLSKKLSESFVFVRVDLYQVKESILVGELTFSPGGGLEPFDSIDWDYTLGDWLDIEMIFKSDLLTDIKGLADG